MGDWTGEEDRQKEQVGDGGARNEACHGKLNTSQFPGT